MRVSKLGRKTSLCLPNYIFLSEEWMILIRTESRPRYRAPYGKKRISLSNELRWSTCSVDHIPLKSFNLSNDNFEMLFLQLKFGTMSKI